MRVPSRVRLFLALIFGVLITACSGKELIDFRVVEGKATGKRFSTDLGEILEINTFSNTKTQVGIKYWPQTLPLPKKYECVKFHARMYRNKDRNFEYQPTGLLFLPCDFDSHPEERLVKGKVWKSWESGKIKYAKVVAFISSSYMKMEIFDEVHFGKLNPQNGDCVRVWISDFHSYNSEHISVLTDRNLVPCEN